MKRGEFWWATLAAPSGSGPGFRRPVLVVQSNPFNESRISTAVVDVSQILTIDKSLLTQRVRALPAQLMSRVDYGLRLVLAL